MPDNKPRHPAIPNTAEYWYKAGKNENFTMAERLFNMEQAYNHAVNALIARHQKSEDSDKEIHELFHTIWTDNVGKDGYIKRNWMKLSQLLNERGIKV